MGKRGKTAKAKMKVFDDTKVRATPSEIAIGDLVLVHQRKQNKLTTPFDPRPFCVIRKNGTMITACHHGKYTMSNASHFKRISKFYVP